MCVSVCETLWVETRGGSRFHLDEAPHTSSSSPRHTQGKGVLPRCCTLPFLLTGKSLSRCLKFNQCNKYKHVYALNWFIQISSVFLRCDTSLFSDTTHIQASMLMSCSSLSLKKKTEVDGNTLRRQFCCCSSTGNSNRSAAEEQISKHVSNSSGLDHQQLLNIPAGDCCTRRVLYLTMMSLILTPPDVQ